MKYLFFDTETTGLVKFNEPANSPNQPRLIQIGCVLAEEDGRIFSSFSSRPSVFSHSTTAARASATFLPAKSGLATLILANSSITCLRGSL